jgi:quercetin dioxygenase-like cupin family protein
VTAGRDGGGEPDLTCATVWPHLAEPSRPGGPIRHIGDVRVHQIGAFFGIDDPQVNWVRFEAGARSRPHIHEVPQLLFVTDGPGIVAMAGGPDQIVAEGQFVLLPAHVVHMHGAPDANPASHISLLPRMHVSFDCAVPEAWQQYTRDPAPGEDH